MLGRVDVGRAQVGDQQVIAGKDVKRQKAVVVVVAVEEPPLLATVHRVVGGIDVEHDLLGRPIKGGDEGLNQDLVDAPSPQGLGAVLQTTQAWRAGQRRVAIDRRLQRQVVAQLAVVVEILVAQGNREYPLAQHVWQAVPNLARLTNVRQSPRHRRR